MARSRKRRPTRLAKVTFDEYAGDLLVGKTGSFGWNPLGEALGSLEEVGPASLTQLRDALRRAGLVGFAVSTDRAEHFDPEYASADDIWFEFQRGKLITKIEGWLDGYAEDDSTLERLISHYLGVRRCVLEFFEVYTYSGNSHFSLTYDTPYYGRRVRAVFALARDTKALLGAAVTGM